MWAEPAARRHASQVVLDSSGPVLARSTRPLRVQNKRTLTSSRCNGPGCSASPKGSGHTPAARDAADANQVLAAITTINNWCWGTTCSSSSVRRVLHLPLPAARCQLETRELTPQRQRRDSNASCSSTPATVGRQKPPPLPKHCGRASARPAARRRGSLVREGRHYYGLRLHRPARRQLARDVGRADGRAPTCT